MSKILKLKDIPTGTFTMDEFTLRSGLGYEDVTRICNGNLSRAVLNDSESYDCHGSFTDDDNWMVFLSCCYVHFIITFANGVVTCKKITSNIFAEFDGLW